ncbi:MAG: MarR family winged helix-turn-helix transcriptional regulator, partial [Rhodoglobus sp.]
DPLAAIEAALFVMRRGGGRGRGAGNGFGHTEGHEPPPWAGNHGRPWGEGGPPMRMRGRGHDHPFGGAARFRLLDLLMHADPASRMGISEIADAIGVDQPRASRLVNEAVERGLVTRRADERDARRSVVELSAAGRTFLESAHATRRSAVTEGLDGFSVDEIATFASLLSRFVANLPR